MRYSITNKTYRVFNKRILVIKESIYIVFDESNDKLFKKKDVLDDDARNLNNKMDDLTLKNHSP